VFLLCAPATALAAKLLVAVNGVDSGTCGTTGDPCRSITQAIANAAAGDTIEVGPGRYGDINRNDVFGETGEEPVEEGFGCGCMILIDKQLTLVSRDGAGATMIDAGGAEVTAVLIQGAAAAGTVFGQKKKGFSLVGGSDVVGLTINGGTTDVFVGGNMALFDGYGFRTDDSGTTFADNWAIGNTFQGFVATAATTLVGNLARENGVGILLIAGGPHVVKGNVSNANLGAGFSLGTVVAGSVLEKNTAIDNHGTGFQIDAGAGSTTVTNNSIFGNGTIATNCGLANDSPSAISATKNFWGAASGPGVDPADALCGSSSGTVFVAPVLAREVKVKLKPLR
jgi:parallel beta-helix repeat protein